MQLNSSFASQALCTWTLVGSRPWRVIRASVNRVDLPAHDKGLKTCRTACNVRPERQAAIAAHHFASLARVKPPWPAGSTAIESSQQTAIKHQGDLDLDDPLLEATLQTLQNWKRSYQLVIEPTLSLRTACGARCIAICGGLCQSWMHVK